MSDDRPALLAQARYEMARRGREPWVGHLARAKVALGECNNVTDMRSWIESLTRPQRAALRSLLLEFGQQSR